MQNHRNGLTAFPLISFLAKGHCYHPKLGAKQRVNQQHNPEIFHGEEIWICTKKSSFLPWYVIQLLIDLPAETIPVK